jgi:anti-sigma regulatory factor (Ser/Thr protein kinase)
VVELRRIRNLRLPTQFSPGKRQIDRLRNVAKLRKVRNNEEKGSPAQSTLRQTFDATPLARDLWAGIAGHFDSITQVLCEFIDNSVSNFEAHKGQLRSIQLDVEELAGGEVRVRIEDTGSGIQAITPSMRLGDQTVRETPLNEHGFGFKHALASADPENENWLIHTRTKLDFQDGRYQKLSAPYDFRLSPETLNVASAPWPGSFNGSGTIVEFKCNSAFFNTVQRGIKGQASFRRCLDYLAEELGYIYSGIIR